MNFWYLIWFLKLFSELCIYKFYTNLYNKHIELHILLGNHTKPLSAGVTKTLPYFIRTFGIIFSSCYPFRNFITTLQSPIIKQISFNCSITARVYQLTRIQFGNNTENLNKILKYLWFFIVLISSIIFEYIKERR